MFLVDKRKKLESTHYPKSSNYEIHSVWSRFGSVRVLTRRTAPELASHADRDHLILGVSVRLPCSHRTKRTALKSRYSPDVVFLQEIIQPFARFLHSCLAADYTIIEGGKEGYFTMMLLKKSSITLERSGIVAYPATHMMRNLLVARVLFKGQKFYLMTSHFESCKANAAERKRQLRLVMRRMSKAREDVTVLFGGDTNLRDAEVAEVGLPSDVCDVWEQLGEPEHCRYTWDTEANTNREMRFKSRFRFDRVYLRPATMDRVPQLEPDGMALVGLEKLKCGRFTSDHWGVYCTFSAEWK